MEELAAIVTEREFCVTWGVRGPRLSGILVTSFASCTPGALQARDHVLNHDLSKGQLCAVQKKKLYDLCVACVECQLNCSSPSEGGAAYFANSMHISSALQ